MKRMRTRTMFWWLTALAVMAGGCTGQANQDKAGGEDPVVLQMANGYASLDYEPAVAYFVNRVAELSDGELRIEVIDEWGESATDFEQQIIRDVASGEVDLGWVGTRIFDTMDVMSFQALTAPMLIDSYPLQEAVIESEIPAQMLEALDPLGVVGLAVLADGLRKPIAVERPLLGPDDWSGITFQSFRSEGQSEAIRALGAQPTDVIFGALDEGLVNGEIQGFEKNLLVYQINAMTAHAPYITANVNLWPQTVAIFANSDRLAALSEKHREWLTTAAEDAAGLSSGLADQDAPMVANLCESGARFANASEADLTALREAFTPVYETLSQDSQTAEFIDQIESIKHSTPAGGGLAIPATCTGVVEAPATPGADEPVSALNGTYRWTITEEDALASPTEDKSPEHLASFPWVFTMTLQDGTWTLSHRDGDGTFTDNPGSEYTVEGDRISMHAGGRINTFTFIVGDDGSLEVTPVLPMEAGDQFVAATHAWTKIEGPRPSGDPAAELNGVYRWTLTEEDVLASPTEDWSAESLATLPWVFTMALQDGAWSLSNRAADGNSVEATNEEMSVSGDRITFQWGSSELRFTFAVDGEGNLNMTPVEPMDAGDQLVWSTHPWTKIES